MIRFFIVILLPFVSLQAGPAHMDTKCHVFYTPEYNISFFGLQKLHPFDGNKYGTAFAALMRARDAGMCDRNAVAVHTPSMVTDEQLLEVHTYDYLQSLQKSATVARIVEIPALKWAPHFLLERQILKPMRYATGGTIQGALFAARHNAFVVNMSGGYHHAKANSGEGFCVYADIPLATHAVWEEHPDARIMIVDLDAHQGNGHESIIQDDQRVAIFDMYNQSIYPHDEEAKQYITYDIPLISGTRDAHYLKLLRVNLVRALEEFKPDLVIYNAGTDIFEEDPIGALKISEKGIIARDAYVVEQVRKRAIPLLMVLSGGYTKKSADIIGKSLINIAQQSFIK